MAQVVNRTTKEFLRSVNTPDYSSSSWVINPDLSAVQGWDSKYWNVQPFPDDNITLMTQVERDAVDAAEAAAALAADQAYATAVTGEAAAIPQSLRAVIQSLNRRINYVINRVSEIHTTLLTLQASTGSPASRIDALPTSYLATNTRPRPQAFQDYRDDVAAGDGDPE